MNARQKRTQASFEYEFGDLEKDIPGKPSRVFGAGLGGLEENTHLPLSWFKGKRILDAGCGSGCWTEQFLKAGAAEVVAADYADSALERTAARCGWKRVKIVRWDLTEPNEDLGKFDLVFSWGVLHHTGDLGGSFRNIASHMKPRGFILLYLYGKQSKLIGMKAEAQRLILSLFPARMRARIIRMFRPDLPYEYFDAYSPLINDQVSREEVMRMFRENGIMTVDAWDGVFALGMRRLNEAVSSIPGSSSGPRS